MKQINNLIQRLDVYQQSHHLPAFIVAVIKKYGDDEAGREAALLTYYGFLSLFPLLLVLTTVTNSVSASYPHLQKTVIDGVTSYFPVLGDQLSQHVHSIHKSGPALLIGILFTLYGARGVADSFRHGVQHAWGIPRKDRAGWPKSLFKSLELITVGGIGFITAAVISGFASAAGHGWAFRSLSIVINLFILFWLFTFLLNVSLPRHISFKQTQAGAATAAVGLVVLQAFGGYILAHELRSLDALYSYFALSLGLLFWIYLQAQVIYYSVEISVVKSQKLWPRRLT